MSDFGNSMVAAGSGLEMGDVQRPHRAQGEASPATRQGNAKVMFRDTYSSADLLGMSTRGSDMREEDYVEKGNPKSNHSYSNVDNWETRQRVY